MTLKTHFFHLLDPSRGKMFTIRVKTTEDFVFAKNRAHDVINTHKYSKNSWSLESIMPAFKEVFEEVSIL